MKCRAVSVTSELIIEMMYIYLCVLIMSDANVSCKLLLRSEYTSVGITNKLMGGPPWQEIASLENFFRGPLWDGPNFV